MKMNKSYFLVVLFLCGLLVGNVFASASASASAAATAPVAGYLGAELRAAAIDGEKAKIEELIAAGADVNATNRYGYTALMEAAARGRENIVEKLLQVDGIDVNAASQAGHTALMMAADENIVKMLLDAGADKDLQNNHDQTAEAVARAKGHENLANMIRDYVRSGRTVKSAKKR